MTKTPTPSGACAPGTDSARQGAGDEQWSRLCSVCGCDTDCGDMQSQAGAWALLLSTSDTGNPQNQANCAKSLGFSEPHSARPGPLENSGHGGLGKGFRWRTQLCKGLQSQGCLASRGFGEGGWGRLGAQRTLNLLALALGWRPVRCEGEERGVRNATSALWVPGWRGRPGHPGEVQQRRWLPGGLSWGLSPTSPWDPRRPAPCAG